MDRNNFDQQQAPPLLETLNGSLFLFKKALPIISMFLEWEKQTKTFTRVMSSLCALECEVHFRAGIE